MFEAQISEGGRVVIPEAIRHCLGVAEGDTVIWMVRDNQVHLTTRKRQFVRARALVQKYAPEESALKLVDELIQERRNEA